MMTSSPEYIAQILRNFNEGQAIFDAYKQFCEDYGDVGYPEFEFWWRRFENGQFDLDYDRSLDPKYRTMMDLPTDLFRNIAEYLSLEERLILSHVSRKMLDVICTIPTGVTRIHLTVLEATSVLWLDGRKVNLVKYNPEVERAELEKPVYLNGDDVICQMAPEDHAAALMDLETILMDPKLKLEVLSIDFEIDEWYYEYGEKWAELVENLENRQIHVENFNVKMARTSPNPLQLLPFLAAKTLKTLKFDSVNKKELIEVVKTEQYLGLEQLSLGEHWRWDEETVDLLVDFRRLSFSVDLYFSVESACRMIEELVSSPVLEHLIIRCCRRTPDEVYRELDLRFTEVIPNQPTLLSYISPDMERRFEIEVEKERIIMRRVFE